ncbi:hypothetical protein C9J03_03960 [Photobacterium gaetbulicola]|uniref:Lon N-terminal domain-containing protein n=1 Tax=Photobacterium gaetbulicola Gung47 TaxID=658445 RepID=A0A0C5WUQ8_9GAMM|nr:hypothetical protein [Photobacterium gaetbulicola]AJR06755.1 hypothetical protein H744_1c1737 [Photobacterium gaetbulicola Gung47]PSU14069.1 hypothetical protein C9J03_03960 [Photobacterium gaetbulicola]
MVSLISNEFKRLPYLKCRDHFMPMGNGNINGTGYRFTHTVTDGLRAGGLWLVMQDDSGQIAGNSGDIIMFAAIEDVDWLSGSQIKLKLAIRHWGKVTASGVQHQHLEGQVYPLWQDSVLPDDDLLVMRLLQLTSEYPNQQLNSGALSSPTNQFNTNWICWRWLEILPIPLGTKQRLLKSPTSEPCLRYLRKIIRQSDRIK